MPKQNIVNCDATYWLNRINDPKSMIHIEGERSFVAHKKKKVMSVDDNIYDKRLGTLTDLDEVDRDYTCECGDMVGKFYLGEMCPLCMTMVEEHDLPDLNKCGWIDIYPHYVINPTCFSLLKSTIGGTALTKILDYQTDIDINGIRNPVASKGKHAFHNMGMTDFRKNFEQIVIHYASTKKDARKDDRMRKAKYLIDIKNRVFVSKIPVISTYLRPVFTSTKSNSMTYDPINKQYATMVSSADLLRKKTSKLRSIGIEPILYQMQVAYNDLWDLIIEQKLNGKYKLINGKVLGLRNSFSCRLLATPLLGDNYALDHMAISYKAFLELYSFEIMNVIINGLYPSPKFNAMTAYEVAGYIESVKYSNELDDDIYSIMMSLVKNHKEGLWNIVNRNPSMDLSSIQVMKIVHVFNTPNVHCIALPLNSLAGLDGDFDGDVLNIFPLKEMCISREYRWAFSPRSLIIDKTGSTLFNDEYGLPKTARIALSAFTSRTTLQDNKLK